MQRIFADYVQMASALYPAFANSETTTSGLTPAPLTVNVLSSEVRSTFHSFIYLMPERYGVTLAMQPSHLMLVLN
jgi:hypothetical protein